MPRAAQVAKQSFQEFLEDECMVRGAAIAYYTIFSLPPLLVVIVWVATAAGQSRERVDRLVAQQIGVPVSVEGQGAQMLEKTERKRTPGSGVFARVAGGLILLFSASGVLAQLQTALNAAWDVEPDSERKGWVNVLVKRALSLGMLAVLGLLLLVSMVLTTLVGEIATFLFSGLSGPVAVTIGIAIDAVTSLLLATLVFGALFMVLPSKRLNWRDVAFGAFVTAVLFTIGKTALGWYLQSSDIGSAWGAAAASMVTILVWVYYTSLIVLLGAEFTAEWSRRTRDEAASGAA